MSLYCRSLLKKSTAICEILIERTLFSSVHFRNLKIGYSFPTDERMCGPLLWKGRILNHFSPEYFDTEAFGLGSKLKPDAVPSNFYFSLQLLRYLKGKRGNLKIRDVSKEWHLLRKMRCKIHFIYIVVDISVKKVVHKSS